MPALPCLTIGKGGEEEGRGGCGRGKRRALGERQGRYQSLPPEKVFIPTKS